MVISELLRSKRVHVAWDSSNIGLLRVIIPFFLQFPESFFFFSLLLLTAELKVGVLVLDVQSSDILVVLVLKHPSHPVALRDLESPRTIFVYLSLPIPRLRLDVVVYPLFLRLLELALALLVVQVFPIEKTKP